MQLSNTLTLFHGFKDTTKDVNGKTSVHIF